jgi:hypothetical protein
MSTPVDGGTYTKGTSIRFDLSAEYDASGTWTAADWSSATAVIRADGSCTTATVASSIVDETGTGDYSLTLETDDLAAQKWWVRIFASGIGPRAAKAPVEIYFHIVSRF